MPDRVAFIPNPATPDQQVLLMDFSGNTVANDSLPHIRRAMEVVAEQPPHSVRTVVDVTGSKFNTEVVEALKELAMRNKPYVIASGVVGVAGLQRVIFDSVISLTGRTNLKVFPTRDEAMRWLAVQT